MARRILPDSAQLCAALADLEWLIDHLQRTHPSLRINLDLAALVGNDYYTGVCFSAFVDDQPQALARGGRYDEVGAAFGRRRPAAGFSLDLKALVQAVPAGELRAAIRASWGEEAALRQAVRKLRQAGETVVCVLPGHEDEGEEYACDRELVLQDGQWSVRSL